ncbi:TPA: hypothetical protein ACRXVS_002483, partial [Pseudomonas aeruginosa]
MAVQALRQLQFPAVERPPRLAEQLAYSLGWHWLRKRDCQSGVWSSGGEKVGDVCGFSSSDHDKGYINILPCKGFDPRVACPGGYERVLVFQADNNYLYSCVK